MNKKIIIILLSVPMLSLGHIEKDQKFTPEQSNTIKSKKLALKLDLNESQEAKLLDLMKTTWSNKPSRINHENLSRD